MVRTIVFLHCDSFLGTISDRSFTLGQMLVIVAAMELRILSTGEKITLSGTLS